MLNDVVTRITEQLGRLRARIEAATRAAGRRSGSVTILAVSKKQPGAAVRAARAAGLEDFGENYVQEALGKINEADPGIHWHFIGHIQSNKTRPIAEHFDWVHTICDARIAGRLSAQRPDDAGDLNVLIQLRPAGAPDGGRGGVDDNEAKALADTIAGLPALRLRGVMIMPMPGLADAELRAEFRRAREVAEQLRDAGHDIDTLSMGMSADFEAAIMEGSTMVRIGTALFGPRD